MIAPRQIGPANALPEQYISPDQESLRSTIKAHTARRMPRKEKYSQHILFRTRTLSQTHQFTRPQIDQLSPVILKRQIPLQPHRRRFLQDRPFLFVEMKR